MKTHQLYKNLAALPHRRTFYLAWPMILSNISTPMMTLADSAMLGHLDSPIHLGAVAVGGNILTLMFWMFSFLRMSTTAAIGQAAGANDELVQLKHFFQYGAIALGLGAILIVLQSITIPLAVLVMAPDEELRKLAIEYCSVRVYAAPAVFLNYVLIGWLIGRQNTIAPLAITIIANLINIVLDYFFIVKLGKGSAGAANASLIAEITSSLLALSIVAPTILRALRKRIIKLAHLKTGWLEKSQNNSDLIVRTTILLLVLNFFTAQGANLGVNALAANALLMQLTLAIALTLDGYAYAVETQVAHAVGARRTTELLRASAAAAFASLVIASALTLVFVIAGNSLIALLTDQQAVRLDAQRYLIWVQLLPLISVWCYVLDGIFVGAAKTREMRNYMVLSSFAVFFPAWWLLKPFGNHGLWAAFTLFNFFRGASLAWAFYALTKNKLWFKSQNTENDKIDDTKSY